MSVTAKNHTLDAGDLTMTISMLETMYGLLHNEQPECCGEEMDLVVLTTSGQERNITKDVPVVIQYLTTHLYCEEGSQCEKGQ